MGRLRWQGSRERSSTWSSIHIANGPTFTLSKHSVQWRVANCLPLGRKSFLHLAVVIGS